MTGEPYTKGCQAQHCSYEAPGWRAQEGDQGNTTCIMFILMLVDVLYCENFSK